MIGPSLASRERLTHAIERGAEHYRPIWMAVRDFGCAYALIAQKAGAFDVTGPMPTILVIGDDLDEALGPSAFHRKSLKRYIRTCEAAIIVSCEPVLTAYAAAATIPVLKRRNVILVETLPRYEADWVALLNGIKPDVVRLIATVRPDSEVRH